MNDILFTIIPAILTGIGTFFYGKTFRGKIETDSVAAAFYQNLLDDASKRLKEAITAIEERDERIKQRDIRIDELIEHVEILTTEIRKYKQLNGKSHDTISADAS